MTDPVHLVPKLDLAAASGLMTALRARKEDEIVLDMSEVQHLGALCMQVIISASTTVAAKNRTITIANASDRVIDQMRVMGVTPEEITRGRR